MENSNHVITTIVYENAKMSGPTYLGKPAQAATAYVSTIVWQPGGPLDFRKTPNPDGTEAPSDAGKVEWDENIDSFQKWKERWDKPTE